MEWKVVKPREVKDGMAEPSSKVREIYPTVTLPLSALPEMEGWDPGKPYTVALKLVMSGLRVSKKKNGEQGYWDNNGEFEVKGVAVMPNDPEKKKSSRRYSRMEK